MKEMKVMGGKLTGMTDTDYFHFLCPECGGHNMCRILDYRIVKDEKGSRYDDNQKLTSRAKKTFTIEFDLYCEKCESHGVVKVSNDTWCGGNIFDIPTFNM